MSERIKYNSIHNPLVNSYFWRTYDGGEIDLVEEKNSTTPVRILFILLFVFLFLGLLVLLFGNFGPGIF